MRPLLLNLYSSPLELIKAAKRTQIYVLDALKSSNLDGKKSIEELIEVFDDISDRMCSVTDSSECIRRLHSEVKWRRVANEAFENVSGLMNDLNSNRNLIEKVNSMPMYGGSDRELAAVLKSFKLDFELFNSCSESEIARLKQLQESVQTAEMEYEKVLDIRTLEKMIRLRFDLARAFGYKNPLEIVLRDKQLDTSEAVLLFLKSPVIQTNLSTKRFVYTNLRAVIDTLIELSNELFGIEVKIDSFRDLGGDLSFQFYICDFCSNFLGNVMFDITARRDKDPQPTHYTIRCRKGSQQPACVLISMVIEDLERISWHQSSSLFHEYGHALHSILSETKYQMLSGSRGPVDLAEIPSNLMEIIHQNHQEKLGKSKFIEIPFEKILQEETFQIQIATFDQLIHSCEPGESNWTRKIANSITYDGIDRFCTVPHLATYGGTYFSYIYSKRIAETIWKQITKEKTLTFAKFKNEFLCRGGNGSIDFINK